ncbi:hypothetical protein KGF54_003778 [Candida jiufengensis]|uniref:uncharacterized protein n=1 Tax=Candida jiufengensis TaxID=497108 RepID=UPI0022242657|nr:uncharacterized protein KGF54_003778 [Candida jiufengensis]KAI5952911.1 hypothetical protein KGF54_003778 [Candida jiufengensis]
MSFPSPPVLKTTIIQLNKELDPEDNNNNYEILTNDYNNNNNNSNNNNLGNSNNIINNTNINNNGSKFKNSNSNDLIPTSPNLESQLPNKKKRRRSTANIDSEELAKRKNETKQLHSIIEKRRRIKINREFEALKYIIPACRNCNNSSTSITNSPSSKKPNIGSNNNNNNNNNNNGSKIDGMYKLTILKSSVEYILYLHHIIQKQHELLINNSNVNDNSNIKSFDIDFAKIPLDVNQYRNIDIDFNFKNLINENNNNNNNDIDQQQDQHQQHQQQQQPILQKLKNEKKPKSKSSNRLHNNHHQIIKEEDEENDEDIDLESEKQNSEEDELSINFNSRSSSLAPTNPSSTTLPNISQTNITKPSLPTPDFTPDMAPILSMLNKYSTSTAQEMRSRKLSNPISPQTFILKSANPSPYTQPLKSTLLPNSTSPSMRGYINSNTINNNNNNNSKFSLPDPAINPQNDIPRDNINNTNKVFQNKMFLSSSNCKRNNDEDDENEDDNEERTEENLKLTDQYASKTLLALRKSSIDSLLN